MAFGRSGGALSSPRLATVLVSLLLVALALLSFTSHLPAALAAVKAHRVAIAVAGYAVLLAGVLLRRF
jgi:hypothetical protein